MDNKDTSNKQQIDENTYNEFKKLMDRTNDGNLVKYVLQLNLEQYNVYLRKYHDDK